ncbi:unnamed protein product, partial [Polarella glacialis]
DQLFDEVLADLKGVECDWGAVCEVLRAAALRHDATELPNEVLNMLLTKSAKAMGFWDPSAKLLSEMRKAMRDKLKEHDTEAPAPGDEPASPTSPKVQHWSLEPLTPKAGDSVQSKDGRMLSLSEYKETDSDNDDNNKDDQTEYEVVLDGTFELSKDGIEEEDDRMLSVSKYKETDSDNDHSNKDDQTVYEVVLGETFELWKDGFEEGTAVLVGMPLDQAWRGSTVSPTVLGHRGSQSSAKTINVSGFTLQEKEKLVPSKVSGFTLQEEDEERAPSKVSGCSLQEEIEEKERERERERGRRRRSLAFLSRKKTKSGRHRRTLAPDFRQKTKSGCLRRILASFHQTRTESVNGQRSRREAPTGWLATVQRNLLSWGIYFLGICFQRFLVVL